MKLSIIVPVYNTSKYLRRCIESILEQSYKNFELILVDDGSMDDSGDICDKYAMHDSRIQVIHKNNGGLATARIAGIHACSGKYIGFVDSDDWIESDMYEKIIQPILEDTKIDISIGGHVVDELDGQLRYPLKKSPKTNYSGWKALEEMFLGETFIWSLCDKVYRKDLLNDEQLLSQWPHSYGEDTFVNSQIFPNARWVTFSPVYAYHYCMHNDSMMHQSFSKKQLVYLDIWRAILDKQGRKNDIIARRVWNLMLTFGLNALYEMHHNYYKFKYEIEECQHILKNYVTLFGTGNIQHTVFWYSILMKTNAEFIQWENEQIIKINDFLQTNQVAHNCLYIYGAGCMAHKLAKYLLEHNINFAGYVVSNKNGIDRILDGKKVFEFREISHQLCWFFLGLNEENTKQVIPILKESGKAYLKFNEFIF